MLVLSRKKDESVVINDNIVVKVINVRGDKVRLGFTAPGSVAINRLEVFQAQLEEAAASHVPEPIQAVA